MATFPGDTFSPETCGAHNACAASEAADRGAGGIGWAIVPYLVGRKADKSGLQNSFYIVAGCVVGLIVFSSLLVYKISALHA